LAAGVAAAGATGLWTLATGREAGWWVFVLHGAAGYLTALLLVPKLARVARRMPTAVHEPRGWAGLAATALALAVVASGVAWAAGARLAALGYNLLNWHILLGFALVAVVSAHMLARARPLLARHLRGRRQALQSGGALLGAVLAWPLQEALIRGLGLPGAARRFTGSRELASFSGNAFPTVSWMADRPAPLDQAGWRLAVRGMVARPLALSLDELDGAAELPAILDCTGGFYTEQIWRGTSVADLLDRAGADKGARWVRFVSVTGYRWSLPLEAARGALLATRVGDERLSHGHGAPARLVAPGERGFIWVKWLVAVELRADPDPGQLLAINLSGLDGADAV